MVSGFYSRSSGSRLRAMRKAMIPTIRIATTIIHHGKPSSESIGKADATISMFPDDESMFIDSPSTHMLVISLPSEYTLMRNPS